MKLKDEEIKTLAINIEQKNATLENRIQILEDDLEQLRKENKLLKAQFIAPQVDDTDVEEIQNEPLDEIESEVEIEASTECEDNYEEENNPFKCSKCDFIDKNGAGLKIHESAKHKENPPKQHKPLMQRFSKVTK